MPARTDRAAFGPIPPDLDLKVLVEATENFEYAPRITYKAIEEHGMDKFQKLVLTHVIQNGKPLVVDGYEERLDPWLFTPKWLRDNHGDKGMITWIPREVCSDLPSRKCAESYLQRQHGLDDWALLKPHGKAH